MINDELIVSERKRQNIVFDKSKKFGIRIIKLCNHLHKAKGDYVIYRQLARSGTSIAANLAEANCAYTRADFYAKISIAYKECGESLCWIDMAYGAGLLSDDEFVSIYTDCNDIFNILTAISKTRDKDK